MSTDERTLSTRDPIEVQTSDAARELTLAVRGLYDTFARYPLPANTGPCSCCHDEAEERVLHSARLRDLTKEMLRGYACDALLTWGALHDFKHFLPRIFEIVATDDFNWPDLEVVFGKLQQAVRVLGGVGLLERDFHHPNVKGLLHGDGGTRQPWTLVRHVRSRVTPRRSPRRPRCFSRRGGGGLARL